MELEKKNQLEIKFVRNNSMRNGERKIVQKISDLLADICEENKNEKNIISKPLKCFYSKNIPLISIKDYLEHIYKYTKMDSSTIVIILIYIDRICNINKCKLSYYIIHKLILAAMMLAIKYNEDEIYSLKFYAKIGGVSLAELCNFEYYFLCLINYNLYISEDLFNKYNDYILSSDSDGDDSDNYNFDDDNDDEDNEETK